MKNLSGADFRILFYLSINDGPKVAFSANNGDSIILLSISRAEVQIEGQLLD